MIMQYFGDRARFSKFLFLSALTFVLTQQIYFPQTHKYFHLALLFVLMVFADAYKVDHRQYHREYQIIGVITFASVVTIAEHLLPISLSAVYLLSLLVAIGLSFSFFMEMKALAGHREAKKCLKEDSLKAFEKGPHFMKGLFYGLMIVLLFAAAYAAYALFTLLL